MSKKLLSFCLIGLLCFVAGCHENHRNGRDHDGPGNHEQEGCGNVTYKGVCGKDGKSVSFCDGNTLKTNTCKEGQTCKLSQDDDGNDVYDCVEGGSFGGDCGAVTFKGVCGEGGKSVSYCDNNTLKTNTCLENQSCQLTKGEDGSEYYDCVEGKPATQTGCGTYTNAGKCANDKKSVTYCSNDGKELVTVKCASNEVCQQLDNDGFKYYDCLIKDPTEFGDLNVECGSVGEGGVCSSDKMAYQYCNAQTNTIWAVKCDSGKSCQWVDDNNYHYLDCVEDKTEPKPSDTCDADFKESCENNVITYCGEGNKIATKNCDKGTTCQQNDNTKKYECVEGGSQQPPSEQPPSDKPGDKPGERPDKPGQRP